MIEKWNQLSLRDKRAICLCVLIITFGLIYAVILEPLSSANEALQIKVNHQQKLLTWMKSASQQLSAAPQKPQTIQTQTGSALSLIQESIKNTAFSNKIIELKQNENNIISLKLDAIDFDSLIAWLTTLNESDGITVYQLTITPVGQPGIVNTEMQLQQGL